MSDHGRSRSSRLMHLTCKAYAMARARRGRERTLVIERFVSLKNAYDAEIATRAIKIAGFVDREYRTPREIAMAIHNN